MELGAVIAERRLRLLDRPDVDVRVRIGAPRPFDEAASDYYCPFQITGIGSGKVRRIGGVDAVQALELTLRVLPSALDGLRKQYPDLRWLDADEGDFGFHLWASSGRDQEPTE
jgi:hypothetical protein